MWGHPLRVRASVPEAADALRAALADRVVSEPAPLGFVVKPPEGAGGFHCLVDRSGLLLARARSWQACVAVLAEHLATFAPAPPGTVRTTMRAVARGDAAEPRAVLVGFPLLSLPPLIERQLERRGQRVLDRLAVDLAADGVLSLTPSPWPALRPTEPPGHCGSDISGARVESVLLPAGAGIALKRHQVVALIASTLAAVAPDAALDLAGSMADQARAVAMNDAAALRHALER